MSVALMLSATASFALPACPSDQTKRYHNCFGTYTLANGDKYVGEFKDDKRNGQGTYTYASGDNYIGGWKDNRKDGQGTYTYADGTVEQGIWKDGVSQSEAVRLWKLDAEKGNPKAQYNLAEAYELGNGVTKNNVLAHMWYNLSLTNDFKLGLTRKNELEQKMKPNEIGQAEAYAELCRNKDYKFCHDENNTFKVGDAVRIIECAPKSKTKRWEVLQA